MSNTFCQRHSRASPSQADEVKTRHPLSSPPPPCFVREKEFSPSSASDPDAPARPSPPAPAPAPPSSTFHSAALIGMTLYSDPIDTSILGGGGRRAPSSLLEAASMYNAALRQIMVESPDNHRIDAAAELFDLAVEVAASQPRPPLPSVDDDDSSAVAEQQSFLEITAVSNAGYAHYVREDYVRSSRCFERSVDLARAALDEFSPLDYENDENDGREEEELALSDAAVRTLLLLAEATTNLSRSYCSARCHNAASAAVREAVSLASVLAELIDDRISNESVDSTYDVSICDRVDNLLDDQVYVEAQIHHRRGEHGAASRRYRRYLSMCSQQRSRRTDSCDEVSLAIRTAAAMHGAAHCLLRRRKSPSQSENDEARRVALMALTVREKALGSQHRDTADTLYLLGDILSESEEHLPETLDLYVRAAAIWEDRLGSNHVKTLKALCNVAIVHREKNELVQASEMCREILGRGLAFVSRALWREVVTFEEDLVREMKEMSVPGADTAAGNRGSAERRFSKSGSSTQLLGERYGEWVGRYPDAAAA